MASRVNHTFGVCLTASLILGGCGGAGNSGFMSNGDAGASEVRNAGLAAAYLSGRVALDAGNLSDASAQFELALAADPENRELRQQLFLLHLADGSFETALEVARQLEDAASTPNEALMLLALEAFAGNDFEASEEKLGSVDNQGINRLLLPFIRAWLVFAKGDVSQAVALIADDAESNGLSVVRDYHRAAMLQISGDAAGALEILQEIVPSGEPVPTRLMLQRAAAAQATGQAGEAKSFLQSQAAVDGENIIRVSAAERLARGETLPSPIMTAADGIGDAILSLGRALADQRGTGPQGVSQALLMGQMTRFVAPRMADSHIFVADLLMRENRFGTAEAVLEDALGDDVFGYEAALVQASLLRQTERYEEAAELLEALSDQRPERTDALIALGQMYSGNRDYQNASDALSRAVGRLSEPSPADWRLFYSRGITFERTNRWPEAEKDFQLALELFPEQPFVLNYLGYSWVDQGLNLDEAKGMLRRAVELRPEDGFIVDSLGWAHYRLGEYDEAVLHLERAIELEPGDPVVNDHLGDAYWKVGRKREARYQWERARLFEPEDDVLATIEDKLANGLGDPPD